MMKRPEKAERQDAVSRAWKDQRGQDLIEYALMGAMVAVAVAAFVPYQIVPSMCHIYSKLISVASTLSPN
jgi:Flp pilus assembly pilin Flp